MLIARAEVRRRRGLLAVLVLVTALVSGTVLAAAGGARRTASVLDRALDSHPLPDLTVGVSHPAFAARPDEVRDLRDSLLALPWADEVIVTEGIQVVGVDAADTSVVEEQEIDFTVDVGPDPDYLEVVDSALLDGRMPTPQSVHEVALNEDAARLFDLGVGDVMVARTISTPTAIALSEGTQAFDYADGPVLRLDVVGVYRFPSILEASSSPAATGSPDLAALVGEVGVFEVAFNVIADGPVDVDVAHALAAEAVPDGFVYESESREWTEPARNAIRAIAFGLGVFALVAAVAGVLAVGQVVTRQVGMARSSNTSLRAMGMSRRGVLWATAIPSIWAVALGGAIGAGVAVAASPLFPISEARSAEVEPGVRVDLPIVVGGSVVLLVALSAWALAASWRPSRRPRPFLTHPPKVRVGRLPGLVPLAGFLGYRSVLGSGRRGDTRSRSAVLGAILGVGGVLAIVVFVTSQHDVARSPERFGWAWDSQPELYGDDPVAVVQALAADPRLDGVGVAECDTVLVDAKVTSACALDVLAGSLSLVYLEGRAPTSPDEIAAGRRTLAEEGLQLGDSLEIEGPSGATATVEIVGEVVQPDELRPDEGLVLSYRRFAELTGDGSERFLVLAYPEGADAEDLERALAAEYPLGFDTGYAHPTAPDDITQLERVRSTLVALAAFLAVLGLVGLLHFLLWSTSRRRQESAVLVALGFLRRQVRAVPRWQALTVVTLGIVIGAPLGIIVGRAAWTSVVGDVGIDAAPTMPWLLGAVVVLVALVGAVAAAVVPGRVLARRRPGEALRTE